MKRHQIICRVATPHYHPGTSEDVGRYTKKRDLQPSHWVANEKKHVDALNDDFPVVMPQRTEGFVEVTVSYWKKHLKGSPIQFSGPIQVKLRHFHCSEDTASKWDLANGQKVWIEKSDGERPGILKNVVVRIDPWSIDEVHLDTDEANALLIEDGDRVDLIIPQAPHV